MTPILTVDDNLDTLEFMAQLLSRLGYRPIVASSALAGLQLLETTEVSLVTTDIVMPEMDGIEFLKQIRRRYPALPVIVITGGGTGLLGPISNLVDALGAAAILTKPFRPAHLAEAIERAIANPMPRSMASVRGAVS
jgi:CheY-like chemotaxis protein